MIFPKMSFLSATLVWTLALVNVQSFAPSVRTVPKVNTVLRYETLTKCIILLTCGCLGMLSLSHSGIDAIA